jgi:L-ascorbate metabolism protein UlaG (beta-lactamase superfamily)
MKPPFQKDEAFLADVRKVLAARGSSLWWLGQSGFLVAHSGRAIVLDPYLSDSLTRKYAATDKPHVRMTERVIDPALLASLGVIDLVTSSHNHTDHFDPETLQPLLSANPQARLAIPAANRESARERLAPEFASRLLQLDDAASAKIAGLTIFGVAAAHPTVERDEAGHCRFLGYVVHWGELTLYHSGDTLEHEWLVPSLKNFAIDVALLPINGDRPERRVAGNLDGPQAARLARAIGARCVVPCHFDLFEFNTDTPDRFLAECRRLRQLYRILRNGEGCDLSSL